MDWRALACLLTGPLAGVSSAQSGGELYRQPPAMETRWASFENPTGAPGQGGQANHGAKGHAFEKIPPGETVTLMEHAGSGTIRRFWLTINPRTPETLRAVRLRMYWDDATRPAVDVPLGDFFGMLHGQTGAFENALFSTGEGRSFTCYIPMPFRRHARMTFTNESSETTMLFYDVNYTVGDRQPDDMRYFHAIWRRENKTSLGRDFEILPTVEGSGRFLGAHIGLLDNPGVRGWWGEGEVKVYLDDDQAWPTLVGTGAEDYAGSAWGLGVFHHRYQGNWSNPAGPAFYRYHVPDPIYFQRRCRVTIQQIGGTPRRNVLKMLEENVEVKPVAMDIDRTSTNLLETGESLADPKFPDKHTNYYRRDDMCAVAFFYLDRPDNHLPELAPVAARTQSLPPPPLKSPR